MPYRKVSEDIEEQSILEVAFRCLFSLQ